jgi:hypothetical protein
MWINNQTIESLDSMDLQDQNAKITLAKKRAHISVQKWILVTWLHRLTYDNHLVARFS